MRRNLLAAIAAQVAAGQFVFAWQSAELSISEAGSRASYTLQTAVDFSSAAVPVGYPVSYVGFDWDAVGDDGAQIVINLSLPSAGVNYPETHMAYSVVLSVDSTGSGSFNVELIRGPYGDLIATIIIDDSNLQPEGDTSLLVGVDVLIASGGGASLRFRYSEGEPEIIDLGMAFAGTGFIGVVISQRPIDSGAGEVVSVKLAGNTVPLREVAS